MDHTAPPPWQDHTQARIVTCKAEGRKPWYLPYEALPTCPPL
jgi:hypothetical protein